MSRFSQYDDDSERLPSGVKRVGYDADTQRYQFQGSNGEMYEGPPGSRYGRLRPAGYDENESDPFIAAAEEANMERLQKDSWRYMLPFFLLCAVFLLALFWWVGRAPKDTVTASPLVNCGERSVEHVIKAGDTCWSIGEIYGITLEVLKQENSQLDCDTLHIGQSLCVPSKT